MNPERIAHAVVRRFLNRTPEMYTYHDDFLQVARVALWRAEARFDPARGTLKSYLWGSALNAVQNEARELRKYTDRTSDYYEFCHQAPREPDYLMYAQLLGRAGRHRGILAQHVAGATYAEIAAELGVSRQAVGQRIQMARGRIAREVGQW